MTVTIDNGDFDPGETTYLIEKPLPKKASTTTTGIHVSTRLYYLKQAAPIFFAMVLSFLAGRNYPTSKAPLVGIASIDSLQSSSRKFPLFQDELQVAQKEQYSYSEEVDEEEKEEEDIDRQLNHTKDDPGLALNISAYIVEEVINRTGNLDMELILKEVNNTFDLGSNESFYERIDALFLHFPDLMEDLSELIEDENHTNLFIQSKNPTILSEVKNFTVTREEMFIHTSDLLDEAVTMGREAQDVSEDSSVQASILDVENGFPPINFLSRKFLDLPVAEIYGNGEEFQEDAVSWEDNFKDLPESVLIIEEAYKSLAETRLSQIKKFQSERTETIDFEDPPSSAPSSAPSSVISRESQRSLRYLTNTPANEKERLITPSELEKMNARRPKKQFTVQPITNTRKLLDLANQHVSSGFSQQLRGLAENHNRTQGQESCDDDDLMCQGSNLLESARQLDEMFCELSDLLGPIDDTMNGLNETRTGIDKSASLSKVVLIALKIGTALPFGVGSFLKGVYDGLKPVETQMIKKLDKAAEDVYKRVIKPWERTIGKVLDQIDDLNLYFMTYSSLIETIGGFLEDESSCLTDILMAVLRKLTGDVDVIDTVRDALKELIPMLSDITNAITGALTPLLRTLKDEAWNKTMDIADAIVEAGNALWGLFSPLEILVDIFNIEIKIPWFRLPYFKKDLGSAQCPSTNWENDFFNQNCYEKCQSGFEDVPHLTAWMCRPTCSSMNSYAGIGGCWNTNYERQTKWPSFFHCEKGWDWVLFRCRKDCRAGFTAPWMARYCYKTSCPNNFSPRLGNMFCARNGKNKRKKPTSCDHYIDDVPAGQRFYKNMFGNCKVQCKEGEFDGGLLGCFPSATLSISVQDIAEALQDIINAIMGLPIVSIVENAVNDIIGLLLKPIQDLVLGLLEKIGNFNLDFLLNGLNLYNPLEGILDSLPELPSPLLTFNVSNFLQNPFDNLLEGIAKFPIPDLLKDLIKCNAQDVTCVLNNLGLPGNIGEEIFKDAENLSDNVTGMLKVLQDCAYDYNPDDAKSIATTISDLIEVPLQDDTCALKLPLPTCGQSSILALQNYAKEISNILNNINLESNSRAAAEANVPRFDGMIKILSVDILSPNDQVFIKSGVHRLHTLPRTDKRSKKEVYDIFRYEKIPSTKLNVYMKQDLSLPVVEYESSIEWNIFTKKKADARSLLTTVVASLNVFLWEEMYWDLEGWCFQWNKRKKKYECDKSSREECESICEIETEILVGCEAEACNVPLMEDLLVENSELSRYWRDETKVDLAARCALSLSNLYNEAVDVKDAFISETRLASNYLLTGLKKDVLKILSVPLSIAKSNSKDESFDGNDYYHLGFGYKTATEMRDISSRTRIKKRNYQISLAQDADDWHSISVGELVNSFQSRKLPIFKDKDMKIGFSGQTVTFSATKAVLNTDITTLEPTKSPTPDPTSRPPTQNPTPVVTPDPTSRPTQNHTPVDLENVALYKSATQSSTDWHDSGASKAVNGDKSGGSLIRTRVERTPWWQVNLGGVYEIRKVVIYNGEYGRNFQLQIIDGSGSTVFRHTDSGSPGDVIPIDIPAGILGMKVKIKIRNGALSFREVEVFGRPLTPSPTPDPTTSPTRPTQRPTESPFRSNNGNAGPPRPR